jgi:type VI secretion system secreted protein Hcp
VQNGGFKMSVPAHLWLYNQSGSLIPGDSLVTGREGSIEMQSFNHGVHIPYDHSFGRLTGTRVHDQLSITKEFDKATPYLYRAVSNGEPLQKAIIKWYRINAAGIEEEFMHFIMENIKVVGITPVMHNFKSSSGLSCNPTESISLAYEKITWLYLDGNIQFTDSWNQRVTA